MVVHCIFMQFLSGYLWQCRSSAIVIQKPPMIADKRLESTVSCCICDVEFSCIHRIAWVPRLRDNIFVPCFFTI